jgi:amino acid transporter
MKRNVIIFGLVLGTIMTGHALYMVNTVYHNPGYEGNDVVGYIAMVIVFSLSGVGIWNYRNKDLGGVISLGKAFTTGALIVFVASTVYVVVWLFYFYLVVPDFIDKYSEHVILTAKKHGASEAELAAKQQSNEQFAEMYKNPVWVVLISYMEVLPIGLLVAFVSSLVLKKKA